MSGMKDPGLLLYLQDLSRWVQNALRWGGLRLDSLGDPWEWDSVFSSPVDNSFPGWDICYFGLLLWNSNNYWVIEWHTHLLIVKQLWKIFRLSNYISIGMTVRKGVGWSFCSLSSKTHLGSCTFWCKWKRNHWWACEGEFCSPICWPLRSWGRDQGLVIWLHMTFWQALSGIQMQTWAVISGPQPHC